MSCVTVEGIGIDIADIARFRGSKMHRDERFIRMTFSEREREYCFSYKDHAPHLAGTFAAKEAVRKVFGDEPLAFADIEVRHCASGKPEIWLKGKRSRTCLVSITHNATIAIAVATTTTL